MATHNVNLDALVQLQEDLSGTISDFGELEVEDLSDMISDTRQKLSEIVVRHKIYASLNYKRISQIRQGVV